MSVEMGKLVSVYIVQSEVGLSGPIDVFIEGVYSSFYDAIEFIESQTIKCVLEDGILVPIDDESLTNNKDFSVIHPQPSDKFLNMWHFNCKPNSSTPRYRLLSYGVNLSKDDLAEIRDRSRFLEEYVNQARHYEGVIKRLEKQIEKMYKAIKMAIPFVFDNCPKSCLYSSECGKTHTECVYEKRFSALMEELGIEVSS